LHPVIIFVDELDQEFGRRGYHGDSGVEARIFRRLLEFIGDNENRGKILWIVASNRPDLVDEALLSRFDWVFPFLLPGRETRKEILFESMPRIVGFEWDSVTQEEEDKIMKATDGFSGRELETVTRRALEIATSDNCSFVRAEHLEEAISRFKHGYDPLMYKFQTMLAIQITKFDDFLPEVNLLPPEILDDEGAKVDQEKLDRVIGEIRTELVRRGRLA
jgi:SpoVK/Ycf46/Vps4 family AAA+-type ATPase